MGLAGADFHARWWLLRHSQPDVPAGLCYGRLDVAALQTSLHSTARRLVTELPQGAILWTSPLQRCELLAHAVKALRPDLTIKIDARIAEMHFGDWEGRLWTDIGQREMAVWTADFLHHAPGGGESVRQMLVRVQAAWHDTALCLRRSSDANVVWVTHAGVVRALHWLARGHAWATLTAADWPLESLACGELAEASRFVGGFHTQA
jgi:alpha-ribazole phosphatase